MATAAACEEAGLGSVLLIEADRLGAGATGGAAGLLIPEAHRGTDPGKGGMNTMADTDATLRVIGGVDTHKDVHVAAVLDELGRLLATASFGANPAGYKQLARWLADFGEVPAVGIEGCGSWGAAVP